ncbi:hypothetical protein AB0D74_48280 [Streptomyces sp. NPDC048278]|uniref:hypothetical protein n=1 Tax=Streptomyces sp. NPDC048278 TaxID=3155809 RepID=UPI00341A67A7
MPKQLDQLPADATSLARRLASLEKEVKELRAARRMGTATVGRLRIYSADGQTLLAELGPTSEGGGGLTTRGNLAADEIPVYASLTYGELRYAPVQDGIAEVPAKASYDVIPESGSDLLLLSGSLQDSDWQAMADLSSVAGGGRPFFLISGTRGTDDDVEAGPCDMDVSGVLTAANLAWGTVSITPSAANTPTSATVSGLDLEGSTFIAYTSPNTSVPGTTGANTGVTGTSANNVTGSGLTVWLNRQNTTTTGVNWLVIGI